MRHAVISDIHGNLEAFESVLNAVSEEMADDYFFVGDVIGYGADPKGCIKLLKSLNPAVSIAGNHEWGALGKLDVSYFSETARDAVTWVSKILDDEEKEYLGSFPLVYQDEKVTLVHGTLNMPEEFYYIFDVEDAYVTLSQMSNALCFVGHSHVPGIFSFEHNKVEYLESTELKMDSEIRYLVNVGSIGQPRDGDPRASFAIYDDEELTIKLKRVEYDVKKAQEKILKAGLPAKLAERLSEGR
jgi:diadenosine tetraphosphatase ApaH/serine/threonine PP2A family protein phosphatase